MSSPGKGWVRPERPVVAAGGRIAVARAVGVVVMTRIIIRLPNANRCT